MTDIMSILCFKVKIKHDINIKYNWPNWVPSNKNYSMYYFVSWFVRTFFLNTPVKIKNSCLFYRTEVNNYANHDQIMENKVLPEYPQCAYSSWKWGNIMCTDTFNLHVLYNDAQNIL